MRRCPLIFRRGCPTASCVCHAQGKAAKESGDKTGSVKTVDGKRVKVGFHDMFIS